jgi:hypothetical protein
MWDIEYQDYEKDKPLVKEQVEPSFGIIGCQMHELNGWGSLGKRVEVTRPGLLRSFFRWLDGTSTS